MSYQKGGREGRLHKAENTSLTTTPEPPNGTDQKGLVMRASKPPGPSTLPLPFIPSQRPSSGHLPEALTVPTPPLLPPSGSLEGGPLDYQGFQQAPQDPPHKSNSPQILALPTQMGDHHLPAMATPPLAGEKDWVELTETAPEWEGLTEMVPEWEGLTETAPEWEGLTEKGYRL